MAVTKINNWMVFCLNADTKPTNMGTGALCWVTDTGEVYRWAPSSWSLLVPGSASTETLASKNITLTDNTVTDTSAALGDIAYFNGTRFVRFARGSNNEVLQSTATTIQWATFNAENCGKATATGDGSSVNFTIAHNIGSNPAHTIVVCSSYTTAFTYTTDATNITVTYAVAPANAQSLIYHWRAVA